MVYSQGVRVTEPTNTPITPALPSWERHHHDYGWVCTECGYHGKTVVGRRVHEGLSWPESCATWKSHFSETQSAHDKPGEFIVRESASEAAQRAAWNVRAAAEAVKNLEKAAERATFAPETRQS